MIRPNKEQNGTVSLERVVNSISLILEFFFIYISRNNPPGETCLMAAIRHGHQEIAEKLVELSPSCVHSKHTNVGQWAVQAMYIIYAGFHTVSKKTGWFIEDLLRVSIFFGPKWNPMFIRVMLWLSCALFSSPYYSNDSSRVHYPCNPLPLPFGVLHYSVHDSYLTPIFFFEIFFVTPPPLSWFWAFFIS